MQPIPDDLARVTFLAEQLHLPRRLRVMDIGARPLEEDTPYHLLLKADLCDVIGFEPQKDEFDKLQADKGPRETYFNTALGNGRAGKLHLYHHPGFTSLFAVREAARLFIATIRRAMQIREVIDMPTKRLDALDLPGDVDYVKIDIQGGELAVLRSGRKALARTVAVFTEVRFFAIYEGEPRFGDLDAELMEQGFEAHNLLHLRRFKIASSQEGSQRRRIGRQIIDADMIYVRALTELPSLDDTQLKMLCMLSEAVFASRDLATACIDELARREAVDSGLAALYLASLPKWAR